MDTIQIDKQRTEKLNQPDLLVLSGHGDEHYYYTVLKDDVPKKCPVCGRTRIKNNATDTRSFNDVVYSPDGVATFVKVEVKFRRYLCLNSACRTQYTIPMNFAEPRSRNSKRLEDLIVRMALWMPFYQVPNHTGNVMTDMGVKKLLYRWISRKDDDYIGVLPETIGIHSIVINGTARTIIVDPVGQYLLDILEDAGTDTLEQWIMNKDITHVKTVIRDFVASYTETVTKLLPKAETMVYTPSIINVLEDALDLKSKRKKSIDLDRGRILITRLKAIDKYGQDFDLNAWTEELVHYEPFSSFHSEISAQKEEIRTYLKCKPALYTSKSSLGMLAEYANKLHGCNFSAVRARLLYSREKKRKINIDADAKKTVVVTSVKEILSYLMNMETNIVNGGEF